jgi:6-phosphofructokinase 1
VRRVNVQSMRYWIARRYMVRLRREDLEDPHQLSRLAATAGISPDEFRAEFGYLAELEPVQTPMPTPV